MKMLKTLLNSQDHPEIGPVHIIICAASNALFCITNALDLCYWLILLIFLCDNFRVCDIQVAEVYIVASPEVIPINYFCCQTSSFTFLHTFFKNRDID